MEPQINNNIPTNLEPKVEPVVEKVEKKTPKMNGVVIGAVILIVCLVLGLTYYVLKDNGIDLLALGKQTDANTETEEDSGTTEQEETSTCENNNGVCDIDVDNEGWALYSLPEYGFSIEIPDNTEKYNFSGDEISYRWGTNHYDGIASDFVLEGLLTNYVHSARVSFSPTQYTENLICEAHCQYEHEFTVNIYTNAEGKTLEQVSSTYYDNWTSKYSDEMNGITNKGLTEKWGMDVSEYTKNIGTGSWSGYIVVSGEYIYDVEYHINPESAESQTIGQKVLDSMKFAE